MSGNTNFFSIKKSEEASAPAPLQETAEAGVAFFAGKSGEAQESAEAGAAFFAGKPAETQGFSETAEPDISQELSEAAAPSSVKKQESPVASENPNFDIKLRLAGVIRESVVDGPGWRFVVFVQGCPHKCPGCQNPQTHDFDGGYETTVGNIVKAVSENKILAGITLSGGEPFTQAPALTVLAREVKALGYDVMAFSGYTFEELLKGANEKNGWAELLHELSYLIDGKFILEQKSLELKFRGSKNQRIIDVRESFRTGKTVTTELPGC